MKAILKSIKPQDTCNILNYFATLIINQTAPKEWTDYLRGKSKKKPAPREVYIYCTKDKAKVCFDSFTFDEYILCYESDCNCEDNINGKVAAKFVLNKVEKIIYREEQKNHYSFGTKTLHPNDLLRRSCLKIEELCQYLGKGTKWIHGEYGYAWHVDNLEIFDKPKELSEFYGAFTQKRYEHIFGNNVIEIDKKYGGLRQPTRGGYEYTYPLTKAPRPWCYIEV